MQTPVHFNLDSPVIAAIATGNALGGVAIIRLSGAESLCVVSTFFSPNQENTTLPTELTYFKPGRIHYGWIIDPNDNTPIDEVVVLVFKAPHSFTGEDCVEIHCHGGVLLSQMILKLCIKHGATLAQPGEFSKRAVLNGKIDLSQAESILDLIQAESEALIKASACNLREKTVAGFIHKLMLRLADLQAKMVASIDYPDEVDEPDRKDLVSELSLILSDVETQLQITKACQFVRAGLKLAIIGEPNVGKSSLFNALLMQERAIVTDIAGTTRDVLSEVLRIDGMPFTLLDTAGLRAHSEDLVERLGITKSLTMLEEADAILWVIDSQNPKSVETLLGNKPQKPVLVVFNKADLLAEPLSPTLDIPSVQVSAKTGDNMASIIHWLKTLTQKLLPNTQTLMILSERQINLLETVKTNAESCLNVLAQKNLPLDLATVPLTDSLIALEAILGLDTSEKVLDSVFANFCVGK